MSPPRLARCGDPFDRALLRAGRNDDPPDGAEDRALAVLGLSAGLAVRSAAARPGPFSTVQWGWSLKAVAIALALGAGVLGAWMAGSRRSSFAAPAAPSVRLAAGQPPSVRSAVVPVRPETAVQTGSPAPIVRVAVPPDESIRHASHMPARGSSPETSAEPARGAQTAVVAAPALSVEIALVQQAARALVSGDAAVALSLLDTYDRQCPHGALVDEAGALRVQALARSGRAPEASALARKLLEVHPYGVLAPRLKGVLNGRPDAESR